MSESCCGVQSKTSVEALEVQALWHKQFEEHALNEGRNAFGKEQTLIMATNAGRLSDVVTGEAPIEQNWQYGLQPGDPQQLKRMRTEKPRLIQSNKIDREALRSLHPQPQWDSYVPRISRARRANSAPASLVTDTRMLCLSATNVLVKDTGRRGSQAVEKENQKGKHKGIRSF